MHFQLPGGHLAEKEPLPPGGVGGGGRARMRAQKIDPRRPPAILVLLGVAGCSYTWATKWRNFELVAPTGSEKTNRHVPLEAGFTQ